MSNGMQECEFAATGPRTLARDQGDQMLVAVLRRIGFPILVTIVTTLTWSSCQAIGSFQTKPAFPSSGEADDTLPSQTVTWPLLSASAFNGCGKGRLRDHKTHDCRGPADIRKIAR
jgi:hypothetical protein